MSVSKTGPTPISIDLSDPLDRYRFTCPRGHTDWERTNSHFWCRSCANGWDVDPVFNELTDRKTRELVERDRIQFAD